MTTPDALVLAPSIQDFWAYYVSPESNPFDGDYRGILEPYRIDPVNTVAAPSSSTISAMVYGADDVLIAFLLWHATVGADPAMNSGRISMLHVISQFLTRLRRAITLWDGKAFSLKRDVLAGNVALADWHSEYLNHLLVNVAVPSASATNIAFIGDPDLGLLDPLNAGDLGI